MRLSFLLVRLLWTWLFSRFCCLFLFHRFGVGLRVLRWIAPNFGDRFRVGSRLGFWLSLLCLLWSCGFSSCCFDCDVGGTENLVAFSAYFDRFSVCSFSEDIGDRAVNADSMLCCITNSVAFGVDCSLAVCVCY